MPQIFRRKKFSYYLGEERALDDIVVSYTSLIPPTPTGTPNVTPSNTPTPNVTSTPTSTLPVTPTPTTTKTPTPTTTTTLTSTSTPTQTPTSTLPLTPTPTGTPTSTPISSPTPTPTATPNPICPQQLILSAATPGLLYGLYNRATTYTGGTFDSVWYNGFDSTLNYGTAPDGNDYVAYSVNSGVDYTSLYAFFNTPASSMDWVISKSTGSTIFNGGVIGLTALLGPDSITNDGTYYYPKSGPQQYNGGYIQYPAVCITPTPTGSPTPTPTTSNTPTPTPTLTPTATEPVGYKLQAEDSSFIQAENGDNINVENTIPNPLDPDATSYINAILAAGGTLSSPQQTAINDYYVGLKAQGLYNKFYYLYLFLGGNSGTNGLNAVNLGTYNGTFNGTWTHDVSGSTANVSPSNYIDTSFAVSIASPSTIETDWSFGCIIRNPLDRATNAYQYAGVGSSPSDYMIIGAALESNNIVQPFFGAGQNIYGSNPPLSNCDGYMVSVSRSGSTAWYSASKTAPSSISAGLLLSSTFTDTYTPPSTSRTIWHNNINGNTAYGQGGTHTLGWSATYLSPSQMDTFISLTNTLQVSFNTNIFTP